VREACRFASPQCERLLRRLLVLDGDLNLYLPDRLDEQWALRELPVPAGRI
jgi:hypothetical protein